MGRLNDITLEEAIKHPIATLLRLFQLRRTGMQPSPPANQPSASATGKKTDDPFTRSSEVLADYIKRRGDLNRIQKYAIFEEMDRDPLVSEILNAYAEAVASINYQKGVVVWTEARSNDIVKINDAMLKRTGYQETSFARVRDLAKSGDVFDGNVYQPNKEGIIALKPYDPWNVARILDDLNRLMGFAPANNSGEPIDIDQDAVPPYDILHIRLLSKDRKSTYGTSIFDSSYEKWEDLQSMEDQVVLQRILRRPDRLIYLLDMGGLSLLESFDAMKEYERRLYKETHVRQGVQFQSRGIPMIESRDLFLPKGPNNETEVQQFPSTTGNDLLRDVEMILARFLGGVGVPRGYFGFEGGDFRADVSLAKQDPRFAKKSMRIQFAFLMGTVQLGMINQALMGLDPFREENQFEVHGMPISAFMEIEYNELLQMRFDLVDRMSRLADDLDLNKETWVRYVLEEVGKLPNDLIEALLKRDTVEKVDKGADREARVALEEAGEEVEKALLFDESMRASRALSFESTEYPTSLVKDKEKAKVETLVEVAAAVEKGEKFGKTWDENIMLDTKGGEAYRAAMKKKADARVKYLETQLQRLS